LDDFEYLKQMGWQKKSIRPILMSLQAHHGTFKRNDYPKDKILDPIWDDYRKITIDVLSQIFQINKYSWKPEKFPNASVTGLLLLGITVMADWIASNENIFPREWPPDIEYWNMNIDDPNMGQNILNWLSNYRDNALMKSENALKMIDLYVQTTWPAAFQFKTLFPLSIYPRFTQLTQIQSYLEQNIPPPGLLIIEAPMGQGKTEAALLTAINWMQQLGFEGIYFGLPTMAMSNQMYKRLDHFLHQFIPQGQIPFKLVHGRAWLIEQQESLNELLTCDIRDSNNLSDDNAEYDKEEFENKCEFEDWFKPKKRSLLSPYAVGTIDQALIGALNVKYGFLRLFGLSSKIVILDEIHAYDAYMDSILFQLIKWLGAMGVPVIMLSATLPDQKKRMFMNNYCPKHELSIPKTLDAEKIPYPLLTSITSTGKVIIKPSLVNDNLPTKQNHELNAQNTQKNEIHKYHIENIFDAFQDAEKIADLAFNYMKDKDHCCICVLVNTVDLAQKIYEVLIQKCQNGDCSNVVLDLFHARFLLRQRNQIENSVLQKYGPPSSKMQAFRPKRSILVSTQVVEQSLDLDFDVMITEIAPIDLLIQRMGRVYRHERDYRNKQEIRKIYVIMPDANPDTPPKFDKTERVYRDRYLLLKTWILLQVQHEFSFPTMIRSLIEYVYQDYSDVLLSNPIFSKKSLLKFKSWIKSSLFDAWNAHVKLEKDFMEKAKIYLNPEPKAQEFSLATQYFSQFKDPDSNLFDDPSLNEIANFYYAKTRADQNTTMTILAEPPLYSDITNNQKKPPTGKIADILQNSVNILSYWFQNTTPSIEKGYSSITKAPKWLGPYLLVPTINGRWSGKQKDTTIELYNDPILGVVIKKT
jgi:CRISPR-associated endonuclease/helicase Cas3